MSPALLRLYLQARPAVVASGVAPEGCVRPVMPPPPHACSLSRCHAFEQLVRLKSNLIGEIGFMSTRAKLYALPLPASPQRQPSPAFLPPQRPATPIGAAAPAPAPDCAFPH